MKRLIVCLPLILSLCLPGILFARENIHHKLKVLLQPDKQFIKVEDTISFPETFLSNNKNIRFTLNKNLTPVSLTKDVKIIPVTDPTATFKSDKNADLIKIRHYKINLPTNSNTITIKYKGKIFNPLEKQREERDRSFSKTTGIVSSKGIYLAGSTNWYPYFNKDLITFDMEVELPDGWNAISQGERIRYNKDEISTFIQWESKQAQDEIFLIGGKFTEYSSQAESIKTYVFLRTPDAKLAARYLETGAQYLKMYSGLIGKYPYSKFALVENFWETGYGMPSFTLLGSRIIRFPFILHSSYPHEILHNWYGNSVFVNSDKGNWSEGLTAYLSDHLIKEQRGKGKEYRRAALRKYADYVDKGKDFPIVEFRSRHSSATEAIGYGKTLMFFHMLRLQLGDKKFIKGLKKFYKENRFKYAAFENLRIAFETVSGNKLDKEFDQWITRAGAPELRVSNPVVQTVGNKYLLTADLEQTQEEEAYKLNIPVAVSLKGHKKAYQTTILMNEKKSKLSFYLPELPLRLDIDPEFDLFRRLDRNETPPALSRAFGDKNSIIILPSKAGKDILIEYRKLAETWQKSPTRKMEIMLDSKIDKLPTDRSIYLLGWENLFKENIAPRIKQYNALIKESGMQIGKTELKRKNHSFILAASGGNSYDYAIVWIAADNIMAIKGLTRKLPHYGKYSYLAFEGNEPSITLKGEWPTVNSPLSIDLKLPTGKPAPVNRELSKLSPRRALAYLPALFSEE